MYYIYKAKLVISNDSVVHSNGRLFISLFMLLVTCTYIVILVKNILANIDRTMCLVLSQ